MTFAYPIIFLLALAMIPLMLLWAFRLERGKQKQLKAFLAAPLIKELTSSVSHRRKQLKVVLFALGISLIVMAVARPQYGYVWEEVKSKGIDVVFAIDTSRSMLAQDIKPNRLSRAKLAVLDFIEKMGTDRIGLVAFSGSAFLQCPLTLDYNAFRQSLEILEPGVIPVPGTDIASAITMAESAFNKENNFKILILITDGEDLETNGIDVAASAASRGVRVFTLGVGSKEGEIIPITDKQGQPDYVRDENGNVVRTRLDEDTLRKISAASKGFYSPLGPLGEGLETVYSLGLEEIPRQELNSRMNKQAIERYQWVLAAGIVLLMLEWLIGTRRSVAKIARQAAIGLVIFGFLGLPNQSVEASPYKAQKHLKKGEFVEAEHLYRLAIEEEPEDMRLVYNLGISLYRQGKYADSVSIFTLAQASQDPDLQADILYNMGNATFRIGESKISDKQPETRKDWAKALEYYQGSLVIRPEDPETLANLKFLKYRIENLVMYDLTLDSNFPEVVELKGAGNYDQGIKRPISVTLMDTEHYRFETWEGDGVEPLDKTKSRVLIDTHKTVTAQLVELVKLQVIVLPGEAGTSDSSGTYDKGQEVDLKFESSFGWRFVQWEGPNIQDPTAPETKIKLDKDTSVIVICEEAKELVFDLDEAE
ncbi:MAG: VWA domain-containing protein [Verrucomicrobia bacterium]|nr:VWA domain-containing protein [Verrucomicrobiota bacterium]MDA1068154.1 VWA domain-containing protein [Verrucomicrobiota bacterium]